MTNYFNDQDGQRADDDTLGSGTWHNRRIPLDGLQGTTYSGIAFGGGTSTDYNFQFASITVSSRDGSVHTIYDGTMDGPYVPVASDGNAARFYVGDHLGSAQMEFSASGAPLSTSQFMPFGAEINHYKFTGLERDDELQQDHAQFRQLAHLQGRWASADPYDGSMDFANPQSLNRYAYVLNNPLGFVDPSGLDHGIDCAEYCGGVSTEEPDDSVDLIQVFIDALVDAGEALEAALGFGHPQMKETNQFQRRCLANCGRSNASTDPRSQSGSFRYVNLVFGDPAPSNGHSEKKCTGLGRGLAGNPGLVGRQGGIPGQTVQLNTAAVTPFQFGFSSGAALSPFAPYIHGTVGTATFTSITDVNGGKSPIPGMNVRQALQRMFPVS